MNKILGYEKFTFIISAILSFLGGIGLGHYCATAAISDGCPTALAGFFFVGILFIISLISFAILTSLFAFGFYIYDNLVLKKDYIIHLENYFPDNGICVVSLICGGLFLFFIACWMIGSFLSCGV